MSSTSKITHLCQQISTHPSYLNLLNQTIQLSLQQPIIQNLSIVTELLNTMIQAKDNDGKVKEFVDKKVRAVFMGICQMVFRKKREEERQEEWLAIMEKCYVMCLEKKELVEYLIEDILMGKQKIPVDWNIKWPPQLLIGIIDKLNSILTSKTSQTLPYELILDLLLSLPAYSDLQIQSSHESTFKSSFQELLLSILSSPCPQNLLKELYHHLGLKILSKMAQPLVLSNHCLHRFQQNPEIQIEILSCLFILVGKFGLELQEFYPKLERLIQQRDQGRSVYELPNSRRFFKLLEAALRSSKVPFRVINNFSQILLKQLPGQQGQFGFWALSFLVNLTKKHRKLLDYIPHLPEFQALKHHYNIKIRSLVTELSKNLNKIDYLQIEDFTKISMKTLTEKKMSSAIRSLEDDQIQFRIPAFEETF